MHTDLSDIEAFLPCRTPDQWVQNALENQEILLIDHANCEKKAASTAINLTYRCTNDFELLNKMSRLAREEMRHFEQVIAIMERRKIVYRHLSASRYAADLRSLVGEGDVDKLVDVLIVGAFIEARSCERFARIAPELDSELCRFYQSLLKSEARHYHDYLVLARRMVSHSVIESRILTISARERWLVESPDVEFRFHSGPVA